MIKEILRRLPFPSLLRAKAVCREWNTTISSPEFNAEDHHYFVAQADADNILLFCGALNRWFHIPLPSTTSPDGIRMCVAEAPAGVYLLLQLNPRLSTKYSMIIFNPVTKQKRSLPPLPSSFVGRAPVKLIAHSHHIDVVFFGSHVNDPPSLWAMIYNSLTNRWRNVYLTDAFPFNYSYSNETSAVHNGGVYLAIPSATHLARYDVASGEFLLRETPGLFGDYVLVLPSFSSLVSCAGKLYFVGIVSNDEEKLVGICDLDDDNDDAWSWNLFSVTPLDSMFQGSSDHFMIVASPDRIWLRIVGIGLLMSFDMRSRKWNALPGCPAEYVNSLFPRRAICGTLSIHDKLSLFDRRYCF